MPVVVSEYEKLRLKNLEDNKKILAELGLWNPFKPLPRVIKKAPKRKRPSDVDVNMNKVVVAGDDKNEDLGSATSCGRRRKSFRLQGKSVADIPVEPLEDEDDDYKPMRAPAKRPNFHGAVPGVDVGTVWPTRLECCIAGVHRPTVAGIHGSDEGAYSIALSGGYEDDIDLGECMTYTGEGGRDLKGTKACPKNLRTAAQSKDQSLVRGNLALSRNVETGKPVRVIRGYKLNSPFAPEEGYRYDGLYIVEKFWFTTGSSGFGVWKFALKRVQDQQPPPWELEGEKLGKADTDSVHPRDSQDSGVGSGESQCSDDEISNSEENPEMVSCPSSVPDSGSLNNSDKQESDTNSIVEVTSPDMEDPLVHPTSDNDHVNSDDTSEPPEMTMPVKKKVHKTSRK